jgi:RimJ/RimL family protein N-acetyltransferase
MAAIRGSLVTLRPARESDRRAVYQWLAESDVTRSMMGPPLFPDSPVPTWDEFCADYAPHFFDGTRPMVGASFVIEVEGDALGQINYEMNALARDTAELDIWLRSEDVTGRGYGTDALVTLTRHLHETHSSVREGRVRRAAHHERRADRHLRTGRLRGQRTAAQERGHPVGWHGTRPGVRGVHLGDVDRTERAFAA